MKILGRISYDTKFGALVASIAMIVGLIMMGVVYFFKP